MTRKTRSDKGKKRPHVVRRASVVHDPETGLVTSREIAELAESEAARQKAEREHAKREARRELQESYEAQWGEPPTRSRQLRWWQNVLDVGGVPAEGVCNSCGEQRDAHDRRQWVYRAFGPVGPHRLMCLSCYRARHETRKTKCRKTRRRNKASRLLDELLRMAQERET